MFSSLSWPVIVQAANLGESVCCIQLREYRRYHPSVDSAQHREEQENSVKYCKNGENLLFCNMKIIYCMLFVIIIGILLYLNTYCEKIKINAAERK